MEIKSVLLYRNAAGDSIQMQKNFTRSAKIQPAKTTKRAVPPDDSFILSMIYFLQSAFTFSKVATVSASGCAVSRETTTMNASATMKAGSSS